MKVARTVRREGVRCLIHMYNHGAAFDPTHWILHSTIITLTNSFLLVQQYAL